MKFQRFRVFLFVLIAFFAGYMFGTNKITASWKDFKPQISFTGKEPPRSFQQVDFSMFWQVWQKIDSEYYDKKSIDAQKLLYGAIGGMVESLGDPYTVFLPPVQNKDFKQGLAGQFEGIGAELAMKDKMIIIVSPIDGSPAQKAGLKTGDGIIKVNGKDTAGLTLPQVVEQIRGPKGTSVELAILPKGAQKTKDVSIIRDTVTVKSTIGWIKEVKDIDKLKDTDILKKNENDKIMYTRISQFGDNTNKEWLGLINDLAINLESDSTIKGVVLDLRNNPGGYLNDATFIASEFIKDGVVVTQERGATGEKTVFSVSRKGLLTEIPVIVLINKGSASASEIVAGALRDYGRAKLIGEKSFGKGTIQQAEDLGNGAGIHVTIAKWLTPKGTWVHGEGLKPDIEVALSEKEPDRDTQLEKAVEELVK